MDSRRFRTIALALAAAAVAHGALYQPLVSSHVGSDTPTYTAGARALASGSYTTPLQAGFFYEVRADAVVDITGLRIDVRFWQEPERQIFRPPGYPLFLALLGGGEGTSRVLVLGAQTLLGGLATLLLAFTVRRWWGPQVALGAAALYALDPWSKRYATILLSEQLTAVAALATAYAFTRAWRERDARWWAGAGALASALTLVRVAFAPAVALILVAALLRPPRLRAAAAAAVAAALLLAPWLAWTSSVAGKPVLASYGQGFNLLLAAHGEGLERTQAEVMGDPGFRAAELEAHALAPPQERFAEDPAAHPRYVVAADERMRTLALERYGRRLGDEPVRVAWETLYRAYFLWNAHEDWYQPEGVLLLPLRLADWATLLLASAGAVLALRRRGAGATVVVFLLLYTAVIALHHVEARFAIPLRGVLFALVALAGAEALATLPQRRDRAASPSSTR